MKKILISLTALVFAAVIWPMAALANPDLFIGDTAIYGGTPTVLQPNVLFIVDDSGSMANAADPLATGASYTNTVSYMETANCTDKSGVPFNLCSQNYIYTSSYAFFYDNLNTMPTTTCVFSVPSTTTPTIRITKYANPYNALSRTGIYNGYSLDATTGGCCYQNVKIPNTSSGTTYTNGICGNATYNVGNYINWSETNPSASASKISIARDVIGTLIQSTSGVKFGLMTFQYKDIVTTTVTTNTCSWNKKHTSCSYGGNTCAQPDCVWVDITTSTNANQGEGATFISYPTTTLLNYVTTVNDMDDVFSGSITNRDALVQALNALTPLHNTPVGESAYEAMRYYQGNTPAFGSTIGTSGTPATYTSPIEYGCQKNYLIIVTDGMSNADDNSVMNEIYSAFSNKWDGGGCTTPPYAAASCNSGDQNHSVAGVAKYMNTHNMVTTSSGTTNVSTYTIGFGLSGADQEAIDLLTMAADANHGGGAYYPASSAQTLSKALTKIIAGIFNITSAFVAPVVPLNPENRTYTGNRLYMGFFKPESSGFWSGNIKKFGLSTVDDPLKRCGTTSDGKALAGQMIDMNGYCATYVDANGDKVDDRDSAAVPPNILDGAIRDGAYSYWNPSGMSQTNDGGDSKKGGVGWMLKNRVVSLSTPTGTIAGGTAVRNIYTFTGTNANLTDSTNAFRSGNAAITASLLGLPGSVILTSTTDDVKKLVNYAHGFDVYSSASNTMLRSWTMGDVLHSKPVVVSYATFTMDPADPNSTTYEKDSTKNKTMIFVGTNDGMLHAFNDYDGSEAWAFIPPAILPQLQYLTGSSHAYYVDSTIRAYVYDRNSNGTITASDGDAVILIMGLRRGGGVDTSPTTGYYYALDITNPAAPKFLWSFSNAKSRYGTAAEASDTTFSEMGETWSEPKMGKIKVGSAEKIAMFFGGGYDNCNEDGRYGATQNFTGSCVGLSATSDGGTDSFTGLPFTSTGSLPVTSLTTTMYKGRAVYAVELATISTTTTNLDFSNTGKKIWSYTYTNNTSPRLAYSMLSELATVDMNDDGHIDRLYAGDSGGNVWRFDISSTSTASWNVEKIFSSNPGASGYPTSANDSTTGRKIFYAPSVLKTQNPNFTWLFFGTGDREHPLNRAVTERYYGVVDKGQTTSDAVTELKMLDVSSDVIQEGSATAVTDFEKYLTTLNNPQDKTYYGWYMRIEGYEHPPDPNNPGTVPSYQGEKVLSPNTVYNGVVYFTTYAPDVTTSSDPCSSGNLGTSRLYALDVKTGMAALNLYGGNDSQYSLGGNKYSNITSASGNYVLKRMDRTKNAGTGIPSGIIIDKNLLLFTCGAGLCTNTAMPGGEVVSVDWGQK